MKRHTIFLVLILVLFLLGCDRRISPNLAVGISGEECNKQGGKITMAQQDGAACKSSEIDLGVVNDVDCICQCCKPK